LNDMPSSSQQRWHYVYHCVERHSYPSYPTHLGNPISKLSPFWLLARLHIQLMLWKKQQFFATLKPNTQQYHPRYLQTQIVLFLLSTST
jgi:hypothetical protein